VLGPSFTPGRRTTPDQRFWKLAGFDGIVSWSQLSRELGLPSALWSNGSLRPTTRAANNSVGCLQNVPWTVRTLPRQVS